MSGTMSQSFSYSAKESISTKQNLLFEMKKQILFTQSTGGGDKTQLRLQSPRLEGALSGALHDACIPFPRTSGVRFNNVGLLVTFSQPLNTKRISLRHQNTTPRFQFYFIYIYC